MRAICVVGLVDVDGRGRVVRTPLDDPDVVGVGVGQDHGVDVGHAAPARAQVLVELARGSPGSPPSTSVIRLPSSIR